MRFNEDNHPPTEIKKKKGHAELKRQPDIAKQQTLPQPQRKAGAYCEQSDQAVGIKVWNAAQKESRPYQEDLSPRKETSAQIDIATNRRTITGLRKRSTRKGVDHRNASNGQDKEMTTKGNTSLTTTTAVAQAIMNTTAHTTRSKQDATPAGTDQEIQALGDQETATKANSNRITTRKEQEAHRTTTKGSHRQTGQ